MKRSVLISAQIWATFPKSVSDVDRTTALAEDVERAFEDFLDKLEERHKGLQLLIVVQHY